MGHHLRVSAWFWKEQASEEQRLCWQGCCRLWTRSVRWEGLDYEELFGGGLEPVVLGGSWHDVISQQVCVWEREKLSNLNVIYSLTISITFTDAFYQAPGCIFHDQVIWSHSHKAVYRLMWYITLLLMSNLIVRPSRVFYSVLTVDKKLKLLAQINLNKCENRLTI